MHPSEGCSLSSVALVFPWCLLHIIFAPVMWCFPIFCRTFCCRYKQIPLPQCHDQSLVLTETGIWGIGCDVQDLTVPTQGTDRSEGKAEEKRGLTWSNLDLDGIVIKRADTSIGSRCLGCPGDPLTEESSTTIEVDDLICALGWGCRCCAPQGYCICCQETVSGGYTISIKSKSTHEEMKCGPLPARRKSKSTHVIMNIHALAADAETVLLAITSAHTQAAAAAAVARRVVEEDMAAALVPEFRRVGV